MTSQATKNARRKEHEELESSREWVTSDVDWNCDVTDDVRNKTIEMILDHLNLKAVKTECNQLGYATEIVLVLNK